MVAPFLFADNARSTIGGALSLGGTTITLATGGGALFPNPAPGQQFAVTLNDLSTQTLFEIVWCTARSGDVLTVLRAQEGTAARAWAIGDYVWNGPTAGQQANFVQIPHMTDATIAPVFAATQVQGALGVTGPAVFSSTGAFAGALTSGDPGGAVASGGIGLAINGPTGAGARILLAGNPGASGTPNKQLRAINGIFDIVNSANSAEILTLTDLGDLGAIRNVAARGTGTFSGAVSSSGIGTFTDTSGSGGVVVNNVGAATANVRLNGPSGSKFIRASSNHLQIVNNAYSAVIADWDDSGNYSSSSGAITCNGSITTNAGNLVTNHDIISNGGWLYINNGQIHCSGNIYGNADIHADGGAVYEGAGARGTGTGTRCTNLNDFPWSSSGNGYLILPNNVIIQWGSGNAYSSNSQTEGGFTWYWGEASWSWPTAFPSFVASFSTVVQDQQGHLAVCANPVSWDTSGMTVSAHTSAQNWTTNFWWIAIGW